MSVSDTVHPFRLPTRFHGAPDREDLPGRPGWHRQDHRSAGRLSRLLASAVPAGTILVIVGLEH